ncbi:hypothetical protein TNCV_932201 [Trichonephila clavipes]|nr:hypothetical protein TNCV_932201 [Trichonephila clavipes]
MTQDRFVTVALGFDVNISLCSSTSHVLNFLIHIHPALRFSGSSASLKETLCSNCVHFSAKFWTRLYKEERRGNETGETPPNLQLGGIQWRCRMFKRIRRRPYTNNLNVAYGTCSARRTSFTQKMFKTTEKRFQICRSPLGKLCPHCLIFIKV